MRTFLKGLWLGGMLSWLCGWGGLGVVGAQGFDPSDPMGLLPDEVREFSDLVDPENLDFNVEIDIQLPNTQIIKKDVKIDEGAYYENPDIPAVPVFYDPVTKPIFTGPGLKPGADIAATMLDPGVSKERDLPTLVIGWVKFFSGIMAVIAVVAVVYAGFLYISAFGEDSQMEKAKNIVLYVILGIILVFAAYAIVNTIMRAVNADRVTVNNYIDTSQGSSGFDYSLMNTPNP